MLKFKLTKVKSKNDLELLFYYWNNSDGVSEPKYPSWSIRTAVSEPEYQRLSIQAEI